MTPSKPKFSRKALNILIFLTAGLILVFSQLGKDTKSPVATDSQPAPVDQPRQSSSPAESAKTQSKGVAKGDSDRNDGDAAKADPISQAMAKQAATGDQADAKAQSKADRVSGILRAEQFFPELADIPEIPEVDFELKPKRFVHSSGMEVLYVQSPSLPMVDVRLVFDAGSARDPKGLAGLASTTSQLLALGTKELDASGVAKTFESLGAQFDTGSYRDMGIASLRVLSDEQYLQPAIQNFIQVTSQIEFRNDDFNREKSRRLIGIAQLEQNPGALVDRAAFTALYGEAHPYGRPSIGTQESVESFTPQMVKDFHGKFYVAKNATLAIVGDIDESQVKAIANDIAAELPGGKQAVALPALEKSQTAAPVYVEFPSKQTHLMMIGPAISRGNSDYYALYLANHILGGAGFASMLNKEIRQKQAFAYSVGSSLVPMAATGPVVINMQTRADQARAAIVATEQVIAKLIENGPSETELENAKRQILSEFALRAANNSSQLGHIASIGFYDLPLDYLASFNEKISEVSAEQVQAMVKKYFENLLVVSAGSADPHAGDAAQTKDESKPAEKAAEVAR